MTLKTFHILFITISSLLAFGIGFWCLWIDAAAASNAYRGGAAASFSAGVVLMIYGFWFYRKMRRLRIIT